MEHEQSGADVQRWLADSMRQVFRTQPELWDWNLGERARVSEILVCLRVKVPIIWNVDIEWNREGKFGGSKQLSIRHGTPDIVIHRRGESGPQSNLLVTEFKNQHTQRGQDKDQEKISYWMARFGYRFGAVVSLDRNSQGVFEPKGLWLHWVDHSIKSHPWSPTDSPSSL